MHLRIKNIGSPSTAGDWVLRVTTPSISREVPFGKISKDLKLKSASGTVTVIPFIGDLSGKLSTHPLAHGGNEEGDLWFMFAHATKDQIMADGGLFTVTALDQDGIPFSVSTTIPIQRSQGEGN